MTTKIKSVRNKYRQAVDSGRQSGHGRVVLLYFELRENLWGGSQATNQILTGIESSFQQLDDDPAEGAASDVDTATHERESSSPYDDSSP